MNEKLIEAFDECLRALENGSSLDDCLRRYPDLAEELKPRLEMLLRTQDVMKSIQPPVGFQAASRAQLLSRAAELEKDAQARKRVNPKDNHRTPADPSHPHESQSIWSGIAAWLLRPLANNAVRIAVLLLVVVLAGVGVWNVSASSLPGSPLYSLKRTIEDSQLALSPNTESRVKLEGDFSERRFQEAQQVTDHGLSVPLEFGGTLESMEGERWSVSGILVIVTPGTTVVGQPEIGLYLWVSGQAQPGGAILASQVIVKGLRLQGQVNEIQSGLWHIAGQVIYTNDDTEIEGNPQTGDLVAVNAWLLPDGSLLAEQIDLLERDTNAPDDDGKHSPENTNTPEPTRLSGSDGESVETLSAATVTVSQEDGDGQSASQTPGDGGSGKNIEPTKTPQPTQISGSGQTSQTPQISGASQTPQPSGSGNSSGPAASPTSAVTQEIRIEGIVQAISGTTWTVAGQVVQVNSSTQIENNPQVGDNVEVRANLQPDGSLLAFRIRVK